MPDADAAPRRGLAVVLVLLLVAGWATNHFAAMIPVLRDSEHLSDQVLAGAFGIYAVGLLPGLLGGGALSDRVGRRRVVLVGSTVAAGGNLLMLCWHPTAGIYAGRLLVGVGVGLVMSAGTAWAADLGGRRGTTIAGATLTAGFACGPLVSGLIAQVLSPPLALIVPFLLTITLSVTAVGWGLATPAPTPHADAAWVPAAEPERRVAIALMTSLPMALWVFSSVTVPIVFLVVRMDGDFSGPWLPGAASAIALGTGVAVQVAARRGDWGARSGVVGACLAAAGFCLAALVDAHPGPVLFLVAAVTLGSAYGLCLRQGLTDVETHTPPEHRGLTLGVFYVCTYLGFGLPVLLEILRPTVGAVVPLLLLAGLALGCAGLRAAMVSTRSGREAPGLPPATRRT